MCSRNGTIVACLTGLVCLAAQPAGAVLVGRVVHVGFPATVGDVVRAGAWAPVVVDLALEGADSFDGYLRVSQRDKDGDLAYDRVSVQLRGEAGSRRRYVLYCVMGPVAGAAGVISVDVLDENSDIVEIISETDGTPVRSLRPAQMPDRLPDNHYLILSLSNRTTGQVTYLEGPDQRDKFDRTIVAAHLRPAELPDRWQGLEMVDAVVWEAADATELTSAQIEALVTWVRQGGRLLIAAARTTDTLAQNKRLSAILPVRIGRVVSETRLEKLRYRLLDSQRRRPGAGGQGDDGSRDFYAEPIPVALCETAPGAETLVYEEELSATVVARRRLDRGSVVFVGAELHDLMGETGLSPITFFKRTLHLRRSRTDVNSPPGSTSLFRFLEQTVGFRRSTGVYLMAAVLFSIAYVGVATFGSWSFLRSRGWTRHSWSVFALVAGAAAVLSLLAVQGMRGVGQSLQQLTVVDATAGETAATATAYFGVKTGTHSLLDVWMPSDYAQLSEPERTDCYLKPLPSSVTELSSGSSYSDPTRYRLVPASALLEDVPVRATLKQFEGRWFGKLRRTLEAKVQIGPRYDDVDTTTQARGIRDGSTITNNLGHPLKDCWLIQPDENPFLRNFSDITPRDQRICVHRVGDIADGETIDLAQRIYTDRQTGAPRPVQDWRKETLGEGQKNWGEKFRPNRPFGGGSEVVESFTLEDYQDALLMLTLLGEHAPTNLQGTFHPGGFDFSRRHCRQLDRSDELTTDRVLLIGFAEDQGPVMLCTRSGGGQFKPLLADRACTMYRFWIPVTNSN